MENTRHSDVIASAVLEFAKGWDGEMMWAADTAPCTCSHPPGLKSQSDHEPACPIHVLLRSGQLMVEEASANLGVEDD
jgi:hypothetical protein